MFGVYLCDGTHIGDSDDRQTIEEMIQSTQDEYPGWDCYIRQGNSIISVVRQDESGKIVMNGTHASVFTKMSEEKPDANA